LLHLPYTLTDGLVSCQKITHHKMERELLGTFFRWDSSKKVGEAHNGDPLKLFEL
jgi:hypothetical protein